MPIRRAVAARLAESHEVISAGIPTRFCRRVVLFATCVRSTTPRISDVGGPGRSLTVFVRRLPQANETFGYFGTCCRAETSPHTSGTCPLRSVACIRACRFEDRRPGRRRPPNAGASRSARHGIELRPSARVLEELRISVLVSISLSKDRRAESRPASFVPLRSGHDGTKNVTDDHVSAQRQSPSPPRSHLGLIDSTRRTALAYNVLDDDAV